MTSPRQQVRYDSLVDDWNRWYAPELRPYLSVEPMVERANDVALEVDSDRGLKVYACAGNMPGHDLDPTGLFGESELSVTSKSNFPKSDFLFCECG